MVTYSIEHIVIVVDDSSEMTGIHSAGLEKQGFQARCFRTAGSAEKFLDENPELEITAAIVDGLGGEWPAVVEPLSRRGTPVWLVSGSSEQRKMAQVQFPNVRISDKQGLSAESPIYQEIARRVAVPVSD
jgi:DNA-binding NtrC family response regulator